MSADLLLGQGDTAQYLRAAYANRHGLIAGATGTGKTITLQVLAEAFSEIGVPVFAADVKGDLSGLSQPGVASPKLLERAAKNGLPGWSPSASPVVFWDVFGKSGHPVRATISEMGPTLLARLLDLSDGEILINGDPAGSSDARAAVSFLPDEPVLYDDLSVREHVAYVAALHGVDLEETEMDELIDRVGLGHRSDDLPARFSRGLRQKTSIALGLVRPFDLLLVDEPFVGLDAGGKSSLLDLLDERNRAGASIVVATHDPTFVERVTRCVALRDGEVVHDGPATSADVLRLVGA